MTESNVTILNKIESYAIFVNGNFKCMYYFPSDGRLSVAVMTAALQSNPTIIFDGFDGENTNSYSVYAEQDFAGKLFIPASVNTEFSQYIDDRNYAFQNNPTVVWIDSEAPMPINSIYSYDGNTLTLIENLSVQ
jgi:hypothetical protein